MFPLLWVVCWTQGVSVDSLKVAFAQYDGPLKVLGRHNEIWAWDEQAPSAAAKPKRSQAKQAAGESSREGVCVLGHSTVKGEFRFSGQPSPPCVRRSPFTSVLSHHFLFSFLSSRTGAKKTDHSKQNKIGGSSAA